MPAAGVRVPCRTGRARSGWRLSIKNNRKGCFPFKAKSVAFTKSFLPDLGGSLGSVNESPPPHLAPAAWHRAGLGSHARWVPGFRHHRPGILERVSCLPGLWLCLRKSKVLSRGILPLQGRTERTGTTSQCHRMGGAAQVAAGSPVGHLGDYEE